MKDMNKHGCFTFWRAFKDQKVPTDGSWKMCNVLAKKSGIKGRKTWHVLNYDKKKLYTILLQPILVN